uniref:Dynein heavy chain hydrolytic ATP-binding dynein motor region domain-containing protein n=1 Tax=Amphimedon queenslandica TaxID=400682 RepID=A0A1X7SYD2_AMPQE
MPLEMMMVPASSIKNRASTDKTSAPYQKMAWEAYNKSINGLINKHCQGLSTRKFNLWVVRYLYSNYSFSIGLFALAVITAQSASPTFTNVYAALVAVINVKFLQIGELITKRLIIYFRKAFARNNKIICLSSVSDCITGRSYKLPDNLKQLLRSLAMTKPDRPLIAQVMLYSQGFRTAETLTSKIVPFFKLCDEQLSNQSHHDFGLRALKSILVSAGNIKRDRIQQLKQELAAQGQTLEETDLSKQLHEQEDEACAVY